MTGETPEVRSNKRKPRGEIEEMGFNPRSSVISHKHRGINYHNHNMVTKSSRGACLLFSLEVRTVSALGINNITIDQKLFFFLLFSFEARRTILASTAEQPAFEI